MNADKNKKMNERQRAPAHLIGGQTVWSSFVLESNVPDSCFRHRLASV